MRSNWRTRHAEAMAKPHAGAESAMSKMVLGLLEYENEHRERFGSDLSDDYVLGPGARKIAEGLRVLLNGELGRLDAGTLDTVLGNIIERMD